jgi:hypothetical protein
LSSWPTQSKGERETVKGKNASWAIASVVTGDVVDAKWEELDTKVRRRTGRSARAW